MAVLQEYKCPCCDGAIEFDSTSQKMKCPYCGSEFEIETLKAWRRGGFPESGGGMLPRDIRCSR